MTRNSESRQKHKMDHFGEPVDYGKYDKVATGVRQAGDKI